MEAADAGIGLIVASPKGIPVLDMARAVGFFKELPADGPNCPASSRPVNARSGSCPAIFTKRAGGRDQPRPAR